MATARVAFERFIPNSPRNESVPTADFSIVIRPFMKLRAPIQERALRQQVAGRVAPDVAGVRREVEELLAAPEHDLDLVDRAAVALEAVVDAGLRTSRPPSCASAHCIEAPSPIRAWRCWNAICRRAELLDGGEGERRAGARASTSVVPWKKPWGPSRPSAPRPAPARDLLLDDRRRGAVAERHDRARDEGAARRRRRASEGRSARRSSTPRRPRRADRGSRSRARAAPACRRPGGSRRPRASARKAGGIARQPLAHRLDVDAGWAGSTRSPGGRHRGLAGRRGGRVARLRASPARRSTYGV